MRSPNIYLFCTRLNQAIELKQLSFVWNYSRQLHLLLNLLKKNRFILTFAITNQNKTIRIFLFYFNNLPMFSHLFIYSKKKQFLTFSRTARKKFQYLAYTFTNPIYIFATSQGYSTQYDLTKTGLGGKLFGVLHI